MEEEGTQAPFNMALDTLKSIRLMIDRITLISIGVGDNAMIEPGTGQHIKYRAVEQLIVISSPLLKEKQREKVNVEFDKIKLGWGRKPSHQGQVSRVVEGYIPMVDKDLNKIVTLIQVELQADGHFMPTADDQDMF